MGHRVSEPAAQGSAWEVFCAFLQLGLTSFGGPVAHIGFFRNELVQRRGWLSDAAYTDLVTLCQFLPGPASSQVGMALGLMRAGKPGLLAAWLGFTLPSALAMLALGLGLLQVGPALSTTLFHGLLQGLAVAAVAVVAGLALRPLAKVSNATHTLSIPVSRRAGAGWLLLGLALLLLLPWWAHHWPHALLTLADTCYRAGTLVFGGGHVVLPLLEAELVGPQGISAADFLAGYGLVQAMPGPLFTLSAYLGVLMPDANGHPVGLLGGAVALLALFVPAGLLLLGALPFWAQLRQRPRAQAALMGTNAAVVGLLLAALWNPVIQHGVLGWPHAALALLAWLALARWPTPPWAVVLGCALIGAVLLG